MHEYRAALVRMRQGDSDRAIARAGLMGRVKARELRDLAGLHGWLDAAVALPDEKEVARGLCDRGSAPRRWGRLHLIVNNTRFAMLCEAGRHRNLGSHALKRICARVSDDREAACGHGLLLAETFVDPARHRGTMHAAAGREVLGETREFSRKGGEHTEAHGEIRRIAVKRLRRDACRLLRREGELPSRWQKKGKVTGHSLIELSSLHEEFSRMRDFRRGEGRKHTPGCAFSVPVLARLGGLVGPLAAVRRGTDAGGAGGARCLA